MLHCSRARVDDGILHTGMVGWFVVPRTDSVMRDDTAQAHETTGGHQ